ncbi:hypothetical protein CFP56_031086 [Quercus suber]|uniref:Uncharacterized protein n=1 Tax=Quercus suber TaxID=58331 RepID=A0AAW0LT17_QUESU
MPGTRKESATPKLLERWLASPLTGTGTAFKLYLLPRHPDKEQTKQKKYCAIFFVLAMILVTRVDAIGQRADQKGKVGEVGVVSTVT